MNGSIPGQGYAHVQDWKRQRQRRLIRLGKYIYGMRATLHKTLRDVADDARTHGEWISTSTLSRIEQLRNDDPDETEEYDHVPDISFMDVWFLARYAGYSLAALEGYLLTGEDAALQPDEHAQAEGMRQAFLSLPEPERTQAAQYMEFLSQQASSRTSNPDAPRSPIRRQRPPKSTAKEPGIGIDAIEVFDK